MFDIRENYMISRKLASQGMVLLKNEDGILPLKSDAKVGIIGKECLALIRGGGGSADVQTEYTKSLPEGFAEKAKENKFLFYENSVSIAQNTDEYTLSLLNELADHFETAVVVFKRNGSEGTDRRLGEQSFPDMDDNAYSGEDTQLVTDDYETSVGYFYPSKRELTLFERLEKSNIHNVVLILNISSTVDLSFINNFSKIKAVILSYLPGMESGTAIADVLCGDVNPSGKLVDTIAYKYEDYPTADCFNYNPKETEYKEGIYVGYRYFETFAKEKVMYPFGFGLSYTEFEYSNCSYIRNEDIITLNVDVKNIGDVPGREVVQAYISAPKGKLEKPAIELKGFYKTKELAPNETEKVEISFKIENLASFDACGVTGYKAAWVVEKGEYKLFVGKSVRDLYLCGTISFDENLNVKQLKLRFDGSKYEFENRKSVNITTVKDKLSLYDVTENKISLEEFVSNLTVDELVHLSQGQPPAFPLGTAGVGNIKKYDIPNPQTADGPAGIRRSVNCTCFPCGTLIACSWDPKLQYAMGKAIGYEGYNTGVDILLAPSMNIHRNPLGGRNFEYLSEDPLVAGKTASAIIKGVQSEGLCATIKHFAVNNCEYNRKTNNSIVSERALREVYLKGFEIAIKESNPAFVMSSYNLLNGLHTSAHAQLLRGVLRDEWGYEGAVMTDWRNGVSLVDEIIAGNNVKMPFGYPDEEQKVLTAYNNGEIGLEILRQNAICVLKAVMKTRSFKNRDFGIRHHIDKKLTFSAVDVNGLSATWVHQAYEKGEWYLYHLGKDQRKQRTFAYYIIDAENSGEYEITCKVSTNCPRSEIWFFDGEETKLGGISLGEATDENKWYEISTNIKLNKGENILKLVFADEPDKEYDFYNGWYSGKEDIRFATLALELMER